MHLPTLAALPMTPIAVWIATRVILHIIDAAVALTITIVALREAPAHERAGILRTIPAVLHPEQSKRKRHEREKTATPNRPGKRHRATR
ncbi:hypothetical protein ABZ805_24935 [Saccharopolyspora sp. NPDC047091]|uniref:hypothetical protein n=1 Tax=Saccharopolyspora sp. NPDC047091 TaxID=3155924 RepID=UPI0033D090D5